MYHCTIQRMYMENYEKFNYKFEVCIILLWNFVSGDRFEIMITQ